MPGLWNPNAPATLGLEWMPVYRSLVNIYGGPHRAQCLEATLTETVDDLRVALGPVTGVGDPLYTLFDVWPLADLEASWPAPPADVWQFAPNSDVAIGAWTTGTGATTTLYNAINDAVVYPPVGGDHIQTFSTTSTIYRCTVNSGAFPLDRWVHRLNIQAVIGRLTVSGTSASRQFAFRLYHVPTATFFTPAPNVWAPYYGQLVTINCGEINPVTMLPWSPQDVREFDVGGDWQIRVESVANAATGSLVTSLGLQVYASNQPDPRAAVGTWARPAGFPPGLQLTDDLVRLDGAGNWTPGWAKVSGEEYAVLWRRADARAVTATAPLARDITWSFAGSEVGPSPVAGMHSRQVGVNTLGQPTIVGPPSDLNGRLDLIVAGAVSLDSQPYKHDPSFSVRSVAPSGTYVAQRMTPDANTSYLGVQFVVKPPTGAAGVESAILEVSVHRVSDGVQMGGTWEVTPALARTGTAMLNAPGFYYLTGFLSAGAALVAGTQYELRFTPIQGPVDANWSLMAGRSDADLPPAGVAGFGGTADGIIDDGSAWNYYDLAAVLQRQPDAPTGLVAEVVPMELSGDSCYCSIRYFDQIVVQWTATSLGLTFARYEVERLDEGYPDWQLVAQVESEEVNAFLGTSINKWTDYQVPRNRAAQYRVRVVETNGATSEWVTTEWVTPQSYGCEVILTSNVAPGRMLVYDREPRISMVDLNNQSDELVRIYGAYGHVSFSEQEDRGVGLRLRVVANFGRQPTDDAGHDIGAEAVFEPLRALARSMGDPVDPIPYVCVLDHEGNRRFARVRITDMDYLNPGWRYYADLDVTPLTRDNGAVVVT